MTPARTDEPRRFCKALTRPRCILADECRERMRRASEEDDPILCRKDCEHRSAGMTRAKDLPRDPASEDQVHIETRGGLHVVGISSDAPQTRLLAPGLKEPPFGWHYCHGCMVEVLRGSRSASDLKLRNSKSGLCRRHASEERVQKIRKGIILPPHCKERMANRKVFRSTKPRKKGN